MSEVITESHAVEEVTKYRIDGKEFDSFARAIESRMDKIGEHIDAISFRTPISPGQKIDLYKWMVDNRKVLTHLLDF